MDAPRPFMEASAQPLAVHTVHSGERVYSVALITGVVDVLPVAEHLLILRSVQVVEVVAMTVDSTDPGYC